MTGALDITRKRLYMRSIRRGIKEMDLILTAFADAHLSAMDEAQLDLYERLLSESDHDLYQWVSGQSDGPEIYADLMATIKDGAVGLTKPEV